MLDPRTVKSILKVIRESGFSDVTVSDGETTVSVSGAKPVQVSPALDQRKTSKAPVPVRSAIDSLKDAPRVFSA